MSRRALSAIAFAVGMVCFGAGRAVARGTLMSDQNAVSGGGATVLTGACLLNGSNPSQCTATVAAKSRCVCSPVGTTSGIAAGGCAVSLSGTTLTLTSANGHTNAVTWHCL